MSRLRHPIRAIREPFGKAGLTVAIVALVFAMVGGAFAAAGLNGKQKKQVTKIAKRYAGKPGKPGPAGPAGPQGSQGLPGAAGANGLPGAAGAAGKNGTNGTNGTNGKSVLVDSFTGGDEPGSKPCSGAGGSEFKVEGSSEVHYVCNGEGGEGGGGLPGTLPSGSTETGAWLLTASNNYSVLSFNIPLAAELPESKVHYIFPNGKEFSTETFEEVTPVNCDGTAAAPTADSGHLCVYTKAASPAAPAFAFILNPNGSVGEGGNPTGGAATTGAILRTAGYEGNAWGTWAVTG